MFWKPRPNALPLLGIDACNPSETQCEVALPSSISGVGLSEADRCGVGGVEGGRGEVSHQEVI
jgi:hypothetical protein